MTNLLFYHSNSNKSKEVIPKLKACLQSSTRTLDISLDDINDLMPGSVVKDEMKIKINRADIIIVLLDIDLINNDDFYDNWQKKLIENHSRILPILIQSFYGAKDLPIATCANRITFDSNIVTTDADCVRVTSILLDNIQKVS
jgi:hypothetical protein